MPKLKLVKPDEAPKARPRNPYSDLFEAAFVEHYGGDPYVHTKAGFVQLAALVKAYGGAIEMDCWRAAVEHYFSSPRMSYTLAHLCTNFAAFKRCAADRYGKPVESKRTGLMDSLKQFE